MYTTSHYYVPVQLKMTLAFPCSGVTTFQLSDRCFIFTTSFTSYCYKFMSYIITESDLPITIPNPILTPDRPKIFIWTFSHRLCHLWGKYYGVFKMEILNIKN